MRATRTAEGYGLLKQVSLTRFEPYEWPKDEVAVRELRKAYRLCHEPWIAAERPVGAQGRGAEHHTKIADAVSLDRSTVVPRVVI